MVNFCLGVGYRSTFKEPLVNLERNLFMNS